MEFLGHKWCLEKKQRTVLKKGLQQLDPLYRYNRPHGNSIVKVYAYMKHRLLIHAWPDEAPKMSTAQSTHLLTWLTVLIVPFNDGFQ